MVAIKITSQFVALAALAASTTSALNIKVPWTTAETNTINFHLPNEIETDSLHNIYVKIDKAFHGDVKVVYGDCESTSSREHHHSIASLKVKRDAHPDRLVWVVPEELPSGCLHAFDGERLIGRSAPVKRSLKKRQVISDVADELGRWFDGVAYMKGKENSGVFIHEAKQKSEFVPRWVCRELG